LTSPSVSLLCSCRCCVSLGMTSLSASTTGGSNETELLMCEAGAHRDILQIQPITDDFERRHFGRGGLVIWYFIQLMWAFAGVAIIADVFMSAIEEVTMATYIKTDKKTGKKKVCKVWNDTVANLSLMALGSSAPEIMLNVLDILLGDFFLGDLGPSTIVGSAAFNLLVILAICVYAVGGEDGATKRIEQTKVYAVTSSFSILAYLWLLVILMMWTPDVVTVEEGVMTFMLFWVVLGLAYAADKNFWDVFGKDNKVAPETSTKAPVPIHLMDDKMIKQLMRTQTGLHGGDMSNASEKEMEEHIAYLMRAMRPVTAATYRNDSLGWLTGKRPRPRMEILPNDVMAQVNELQAAAAASPMLAQVAGGAATLSFKDAAIEVEESCGHAVLTVLRIGATDGTCSCDFETANISAMAGKDYTATQGTLNFEPGEKEKTISIAIIDSDAAEGKEKFRVCLSQATNCTLDSNGIAIVTIRDDDSKGKGSMMAGVLNRVRNRDKWDAVKEQWWGQIVDAATCPREEGQQPTRGQWTAHCVVVFWKVTFALVPPTTLWGGWASFTVALTFIAFCTMYIGDTAEFMGCALDLKPGVTAITFVAIGTSLPDTFASKKAAVDDDAADNSVGNVTGSNCVNVFLGLGLPWMIGAIYWSSGPNAEWLERYSQYSNVQPYLTKGVFVVKDDNLSFSVIVFSCCACCCLGILSLRRKMFGGELGGPKTAKALTAVAFVFLWLIYAILSVCKTYSVL